MKTGHLLSILVLLLALSSCSTVRVLSEDEYRLTANKIEVVNDEKFNSRDLQPYIKQKAKGWNPFMVVYNWANPERNTLFDRINRKIGVEPVVFDQSQIESSIASIERHLQYVGWYNSTVTATPEYNGKKVKVNYSVSLGKQFTIDSLNFVIPQEEEFVKAFTEDCPNITIKVGSILSEASLEQESNRSSQYFRNLGYYGFSKHYYFFEADTLTKPNSATLEMRIEGYTRNEDPSMAKKFSKFHFGNIDISYPKSMKIRDKVLYDLNTIYPGELYSEEAVNRTYRRLSSLRMLNSVNIELNQVDSSIVDCNIHLSPSKPQGFKINLEGSTNSSGLLGVSPELSFYHKNIFNGGEVLNLSFMGNFQFRPNSDVKSNEFGVSTGLSLPRFLFIPSYRFKNDVPRTEISTSFNFQDRPEYKRTIISTSFGFTGSKGNFYYQLFPIQLNIVRLFNLDYGFYSSLENNPFMRNAYQNHFDFGMGTLFNYTTDASANPQKTYRYARLQINTAGNLLNSFRSLMKQDESGSRIIWDTPFSQYIRTELTLGKTWRFGKANGQAIATRLLGGIGYAYGNSTVLPFEQHFYSGGASSLRGWQARSVGPGFAKMNETFVIPNQTGDMKLEANIEYRFNLFWKLAGALFVDAGNIWNLNTNNSSELDERFSFKNFTQSIAADGGFGIRLDLSFILVRVDLGMKIHDPSRDYGQRWISPRQWLNHDSYAVHFGVGYPF